MGCYRKPLFPIESTGPIKLGTSFWDYRRMGGYGSGRTGGRPTYESTRSLILRTTSFARAGLRFGIRSNCTLTYGCNGDPFAVAMVIDTMDPLSPYIELEHRRRTHSADLERYRIYLGTTRQPFGGVRWWFLCPRTRRRSVRLFLPLGGHQFWSRHVYGLGYASQREDRMGRAQRQAEKVYAALGGDGNFMDGPPAKPKWMRWATYEHQAARLEAYNDRFDGAWSIGVARLLARPLKRRR